MKTIVISGVIGWDVSPADIRKQIAEAVGNEPLDIQINSPGGFVTDGLEIFNIIRNYAGPKTTHLMGLAASMGSYIALAGDKVTAEANVIYMIHNVLGVAVGNHNEIRKTADIFEGLSVLLAQAYVKKTGKPMAEVRKMMDDETYLFGSEAKDAGFIDEIIGEPSEEKALAIALARAARATCDETVKKGSDAGALDRIAAMISIAPSPQASIAGVASSAAVAAPAAADIKPKEVQNMDPTKLKAEHPDVFNAVKAEGYEEGKAAGIAEGKASGAAEASAAERERITSIDALGLTGEAAKIAEDAKADGKSTAADVALKVVQASKGKAIQTLAARAADAALLPANVPAGAAADGVDEVQAEVEKFNAAKKKVEGGK